MKPKLSKVFWIINQEMFKPKMNEYTWMDETVKDNIDYIVYQKVIPVYVKCTSDMYDGTTQFDITPVDVRGSKKSKHWKWSRSVEDKEVGVSVFESKEDAEKVFNNTYSDEQRAKFEEKDSFRNLTST